MNFISYRTLGLLFFFIFYTCTSLEAQVTGTVPSPYESIEQNSVSNMGGLGDTLWIGPGLNRNIGNSEEWYLPVNADSITSGRGRVFSLALAPDTVWVGIGFNSSSPDGTVQTGMGYYFSSDGGDAWDFYKLPLDSEDDTSFVYGGKQYKILPITVPQQSPPFEIDFGNRTVLSANWGSGIMRSQNLGEQWERLVLPPQAADSLVPEESYTFTSERYDPRVDQNLLAFSVLVDQNDKVWAGTAGGINISSNALTARRDSIRWRHVQAGDTGLLGNWIITITEQPTTGDIWMTTWPSGVAPNEQYGVVRTNDDGQTFEQYLVNQQINDIGFSGNHIFAAGNNGLFISPDNGQTWNLVEQIQDNNTFIKSTAGYLSVAVTSNRVWIGTTDGLASTADLGQTWEITRVNFPLKGGNQYQPDAPGVDTFAYPNPFSPLRQELVRIKFQVHQQGNVKIRLFDFGMNLIRELENNSYTPGTYEATWNGKDNNGNAVANGPVFYQVETPGTIARGKILVLD